VAERRYEQVLEAVRTEPWAITSEAFAQVLEVVRLRVAGVRFDEDELRERIGSGPAHRPTYGTAGGVAVLPIVGVLFPKASLFSQVSGATSMDQLRASLRAALADERVRSIFFDVDSPGGSVSGVAEATADIRAARSQKRVAVTPGGSSRRQRRATRSSRRCCS
jgi:ClpP class serine protease